MIAREIPGNSYVLDPPIEHDGREFAHVVIQGLQDMDGTKKSVIFSALDYPHPLDVVDGWHDDAVVFEYAGYSMIPLNYPETPSDMVREFHVTFGHPVKVEPQLLPRDRSDFRMELIREEFDELVDAEADRDLVEMADALGDLVYVIYGFAHELGIPLDDVVREIHASNMSKLDENGNPIYRDDGKVLKGPNYWEPDIKSVLSRA